eukprot:TRINITY_DN11408_c0_g1_i1.p1 TRINITY_DN11408_c0_g1~~TRINITY_DN11408_c0_g1_i1.p1  ORF type:complete len:434 (+),score=-60.40 TRINITY_DN11408_c0_g1_i1:975-2276(+)
MLKKISKCVAVGCALSCMVTATAVFADKAPYGGGAGYSALKGSNADPSAAIQDLGNKIVALSFAGMTAFNQAMYQFDSNLIQAAQADQASYATTQAMASQPNPVTTFVGDVLQNFSNAFASTSFLAVNAQKIQSAIQAQNALVNNLTIGVPASDTLYINDPSVLSATYSSFTPLLDKYYNSTQSYSLGPVTLNRNNYFTMDTVIDPEGYTQDQLAGANAYMDYLTQRYKNPAEQFDIAGLKSYIGSLRSEQAGAALYSFLTSSEYQQYQLAVRSLMAVRSIGVGNFEHFIAERTPSAKPISGVQDSAGNAITNPSVLQAEAYRAHFRTQDGKWVQSLQQMSSASLQREIAVELATIIEQNHQAHEDSERILATLSSMQLQQADSLDAGLANLIHTVNQKIAALSGSSAQPPATNTTAQNVAAAQSAANQKASP